VKVLVVDDNRPVLATTVMFLQSHKLDATGADSAEEALSIYGNDSFDVVVTDYSMPGKDGFELAAQLLGYAQDHASPPGLILITGLELSPQDVLKARELFDEILIKPFRLETLASAIVAANRRADQ